MKKNPIDIVYSTNTDFKFQYQQEDTQETLPSEQQHLKLMLDKKQRAGKAVTLINGFIGKEEDLQALG